MACGVSDIHTYCTFRDVNSDLLNLDHPAQTIPGAPGFTRTTRANCLLKQLQLIKDSMAAFWAVHVFTFGGGGPALTARGSLDLKQEL
jgi:hypothetical protein